VSHQVCVSSWTHDTNCWTVAGQLAPSEYWATQLATSVGAVRLPPLLPASQAIVLPYPPCSCAAQSHSACQSAADRSAIRFEESKFGPDELGKLVEAPHAITTETARRHRLIVARVIVHPSKFAAQSHARGSRQQLLRRKRVTRPAGASGPPDTPDVHKTRSSGTSRDHQVLGTNPVHGRPVAPRPRSIAQQQLHPRRTIHISTDGR
jgi:hypothetical protein